MFKIMKLQNEVDKMIKDIEQEVLYTRNFIDRDHFDEQVMKAIRTIPRHEFVPQQQRTMAYYNGPLIIGHGQTISQPYIVALMTDLLEITPDCNILEIGTGSGYQTAVLAQLAKNVYSVEIIPELLTEAQERLATLGYTNIKTCIADGHNGWAEYAPYDGVIVTAAAEQIPPALIEQLKPGGRLVMPVGSQYGDQDLILLRKDQAGEVVRRNVLSVAFVPLVTMTKTH